MSKQEDVGVNSIGLRSECVAHHDVCNEFSPQPTRPGRCTCSMLVVYAFVAKSRRLVAWYSPRESPTKTKARPRNADAQSISSAVGNRSRASCDGMRSSKTRSGGGTDPLRCQSHGLLLRCSLMNLLYLESNIEEVEALPTRPVNA